jgi:hypothetical protein
MSNNTHPLKLPASVKKAAAELVATDGVSLNQIHCGCGGRKDRFPARRRRPAHGRSGGDRSGGCLSRVVGR